MQAGTELNALVGERVMGWGKGWADPRFGPSQFPSDASMVVRRLNQEGWSVTVRSMADGWHACEVSNTRTGGYHLVSDQDSACVAICLAALRALGVGVE